MLAMIQNNLNPILADEMGIFCNFNFLGLGKTVQSISLLDQLRKTSAKNLFLVLVPLSLLSHWKEQITRFCPLLSVVCYVGNRETRENLQSVDGDIILTTFDYVNSDISWFEGKQWSCLIVDVKNRNLMEFLDS